jgi:hypothetical protein
MKELIVRFLIGGVIVSSFAALGEVFRPKSFGGLFGGCAFYRAGYDRPDDCA